MISDETLRQVLPKRAVLIGGDLIRVGLGIILAIWCAIWLIVAGVLAQHNIRNSYYSDFGRFLYSTREFMAGREVYEPVPADHRAQQYATRQRTDLNPPHMHFALLPIASLPDIWAYALWMLAGLTALIWAARATLESLGKHATLGLTSTLIAGMVCSVPFLAWATTGQVTMLLLGPLTAAWRAARNGRWTRAGCWLGLAASLKPFLFIFMAYLLFTRRFRASAASIAVLGLSFGVGIAVFGWQNHLGWIDDLRQVAWFSEAWNTSIIGVASRGLTAGFGFQPIVEAPHLVGPASILGGAVLLALTARVIARSTSVDRDWALLMLTALSLSPLAWVYYWSWLAGPLAAVWLQTRHSGRAMWIGGTLGGSTFWFPWPLLFWGQPSGALSVTLGSTYAYGLLLMWVSIADAEPPTSPAPGTRSGRQ